MTDIVPVIPRPAAGRRAAIHVAFAIVALLAGGNAAAQSSNGSNGSPADAPPRAEVLRLEDAALKLDGRLDDPAWASAWESGGFISGFEQKGARRGFPVSDQTEVVFLYDDEALYIGARMHAADPSSINAPRSQRDDIANADRIIVSLDTYRNRETAYNFGVTAGGTRIDYYQPEDVFLTRDYTFDPVWEARVAIEEGGWTAELRIPFSSLEFNPAEALVWGVNVQRVSPAQRMYAFWVVVPGNEPGWASRFGNLVGLQGVPSPQRIAVTPYVAAQKTTTVVPPAPFRTFAAEPDPADWRYGGDILYDLTPSVALEATINPDFGQIEADAAVVNLSAFETFFPEKRPFFQRGNQLLQGQGPRYYYSRRIGGAPHGSVEGPVDDEPLGTTILAAGKLIGRLPSGLSVAGLFAATDDEQARIADPDTGSSATTRIEPKTLFGIGRVQRDLGAGSTFGAVGTVVHRAMSDEEPLAAIVPAQAVSGGADWNLRFAGSTHQFGGYVGGSAVQGSPGAIVRLQGSSARYYQRPDADHVHVDPSRALLAGYTAGVHAGRIQGPLHWTLGADARSPGFEINDAGAMATADDIDAFAQIGYGTPMGNALLQRVDVSASVAMGWNFGNVRQYTTPALDIGLVWKNFWRSYLQLTYDLPELSDSLTRGGPLMGTAQRWRARFGFSSNDARPHVLAVDASYAGDELGGWAYDIGTRLSLRLNDHLWLAVNPGIEQAHDARQFFTHVEGGRPETFGRRYVFAALDRTTYFARVRGRLDVTSGFGVELYAEPFRARGDYGHFGELAAASTDELRVYGIAADTSVTPLPDGSHVVVDEGRTFELGNGDFTIRSLRSNLAARWDYRQGSTLWLVWQRNQLVDGPVGALAPDDTPYGVFSAPAENVFAVKLSFRVGLRP